MKVSILVHNVNRVSDLRRCLESIVSQSYRPLEVVLLDAGSTDGSLELGEEFDHKFRNAEIEFKFEQCELLGVAASRNLAASRATGELLVFIDNDACFASNGALDEVVRSFANHENLALVAFRIRERESSNIDSSAWVYRRSAKTWARTSFVTFTFAGGGFCIRADVFSQLRGFWSVLRYSREEEDLAMGIIQQGYDILYLPKVEICHFPNPRGRLAVSQRRWTELRNGLLVYWRRFPIPIAIVVIAARVLSMTVKIIVRGEGSPRYLLSAIPSAISEWKSLQLVSQRVSFASVLRYLLLHCGPRVKEEIS